MKILERGSETNADDQRPQRLPNTLSGCLIRTAFRISICLCLFIIYLLYLFQSLRVVKQVHRNRLSTVVRCSQCSELKLTITGLQATARNRTDHHRLFHLIPTPLVNFCAGILLCEIDGRGRRLCADRGAPIISLPNRRRRCFRRHDNCSSPPTARTQRRAATLPRWCVYARGYRLTPCLQ